MRPRLRDMLVDGRHIAETAWLAALIAAPLLFVPENPRPFEFTNTVLVRSLAISLGSLVLALRLAGHKWGNSQSPVTQSGSGSRRLHRILTGPVDPILAASIFLLAANLASTALSVAPTISFFGSTQRNQGLLTTLGYLAIFWMATASYVGKSQRGRGEFVLSIAGLIVSVYAIQQSLGLDPVPLDPSWESSRVASTLGNPVFLGAFLILVIPLIAGRLAEAAAAVQDELAAPFPLLHLVVLPAALVILIWVWLGGPAWMAPHLLGAEGAERGSAKFYAGCALVGATLAVFWWGGRRFRSSSLLSAGAYLAILSALVAALILTKSRGPAAGLVAAVLTLALLYAAAARHRRLAIGLVVAAALGLASLLGMWALDASGRISLCADPTLGRIVCPLPESPGVIQARPLIWRASAELILPHEPIHSPLSGSDRWNALRPAIGYGPETLLAIFPQFAPPELNRIFPAGVSVDRAHNGLLDTLVETGLLGLLAKLALVAVVLQRTLAWLGILRTRRDGLTLVILVGIGLASGGLLAVTVFEPDYGAVGLVSGAAVGLWTFLIWSALRRSAVGEVSQRSTSLVPVIAITASLTGHLIEQQFSFPTTATQVYSWFLLAVLAVLLRSSPGSEGTSDTTEPDETAAAGIRSGATHGTLLGAALAVPAFAYLQAAARYSSGGAAADPFTLIRSALLQRPDLEGMHFEPAIGLGFLIVGAVGLALYRAGQPLASAGSDRSGAVLAFAASSAVMFSAGVPLLALQVLATRAGPSREMAFLSIVGWLLAAVILGLAVVALVQVSRQPLSIDERAMAAAAVVGLGAIALLVVSVNVGVLRSDALFRLAVAEADLETRLQVASLAAESQPQKFAAHSTLGQVKAAAALEAERPAQRQALVQEAEFAWRQAQASNPFDHRTEAALAGLHRALAERSGAAAERLRELDAAIDHDRNAIELSPNSAHLHALLGRDLWLRAEVRQEIGIPAGGDRGEARSAIARAAGLDSESCFVMAARALVDGTWRGSVRLALSALHRVDCRRGAEILTAEAQETSLRALAGARALAQEMGEETLLADEVRTFSDPERTLAIVMAIARRYREEGRLGDAAQLEQLAALLWPESVEQ